uniref:Oligoventin n=1 Tax=Phoneutria nigriventer TaxID=6918 RepID=OLVTN_PHONI|nr:RecName: Full=Oligoventin [Phoneutria nigriventer]
QPFSLERW